MAGRRMMKRRGRPRPMDWVANSESWDLTTPPFTLNPFLNASANYASSNAVGAMLTFHKDLVDELNEMGSPQLEQTAIRVVGDCHFWMMTFDESVMPTVNLLLDVHLRVVVATQLPDSLVVSEVTSPDYNMDTPWVANDDFLWHHHQMMVLSNSYWTDVTAEIAPDWRVPQRVPIDVRVQRRLKQREVLVLLMQVSQKALIGPGGISQYNTWADLRMCFQPCVRTLVRTIT